MKWNVLKYSEIVFPNTLKPLKHISTTKNCTTIGTFTLDTINKIVKDIQEAISLSKMSIISSKLLSPLEIAIIQQLLEDQGVKSDIPDEIISYITSKIAVNNKKLLVSYSVSITDKRNSSALDRRPRTFWQNTVIHVARLLGAWCNEVLVAGMLEITELVVDGEYMMSVCVIEPAWQRETHFDASRYP